jgi:hypothetical protein
MDRDRVESLGCIERGGAGVDTCYFLEICPDVERRGQFIFVRNGKRRTMVPRLVMAEFVAKVQLALMDQCDGKVVPIRARH